MFRQSGGLKLVAFKFSPLTISRLEEIRQRRQREVGLKGFNAAATKTDVMRWLIAREIERMELEAIERNKEIEKQEAKAKRKANDKKKPTPKKGK